MVTIPSKGWLSNPPAEEPDAKDCGYCELHGKPCQEHQELPTITVDASVDMAKCYYCAASVGGICVAHEQQLSPC